MASLTLICLGSNLPHDNLGLQDIVGKAFIALGSAFGCRIHESAYYRTPAFPAGSGPDFVNAACAVENLSLEPEAILKVLHQIEQDFGRERRVRWGARVLDLDLIAHGAAIRPDPRTQQAWVDLPLRAQSRVAPKGLILPHPRLQERSFVLRPLMDVAPEWRHPVLGQTIAEMYAALPPEAAAEITRLD